MSGAARGEGALGAALLVAGAACAFGAISTLTVLAAAGGAGPPLVTVLFWRYLIAGVVLVALPGGRAWRPLGRRGPMPWRALMWGGGGQAVVAYLSLSAVRWIPVATLGFLFYTFPAWVVLFAAVRGTERLDRTKLGALGLSLAGIACTVGLPGSRGPTWGTAGPGVLLALGAAVVYALYIPYLGRLQHRETPAGAAILISLGATVIFGVLDRLTGTALAPWHYPAASWAAIAVLAILCTVVAFTAFMRGLATLGPVRTAIVSTVEPFFTAVLGALVLGQSFGAATLAGGALIAAAVLLLQRPARGPAAVPQTA